MSIVLAGIQITFYEYCISKLSHFLWTLYFVLASLRTIFVCIVLAGQTSFYELSINWSKYFLLALYLQIELLLMNIVLLTSRTTFYEYCVTGRTTF